MNTTTDRVIPSAIALANSLNWGIYASASSEAVIQAMREDDRKARKAIDSLKKDLPVDDEPVTKEATWGFKGYGIVPIVPETTAEAPEEPQEASGGAVGNEPPDVPESAFAEMLNFSQASQQIVPPPKPSQPTKMMLDANKTKATAHELRDWIYTELQYQQSLLQNTQRGLSKNDARKLAAIGISNKLMASDIRVAYAEMMDKAFASLDVEMLQSVKERIIADYPRQP